MYHSSTLPPHLQPGERVILFDGVCKLCAGWVRFIVKHDRAKHLRLCSVQSEQGQDLLRWCGLPTDHFDTMAYLADGEIYLRSDAVLRIARLLPWPWPLFAVLRICPRALRDWCYDRIALNRYRWFGRNDSCLIPNPDHAQRFLHD